MIDPGNEVVSWRYENRKVTQKQVQRPDFVGFQRLKCSNSLPYTVVFHS